MSQSWKKYTTLEAASKHASTAPGVYAIGTVVRLEGLPLSCEWAYIGMGGNLRSRIAQHLPNTEANKKLRAWIQGRYGTVEIWAISTDTEKSADALETSLIGKINPIFNTRKRTNLTDGEDDVES